MREVARLPRHQSDVTQFAWSKDGSLLASGDKRGSIQLWDWASQKDKGLWPISVQKIESLAIALDNASVAVATAKPADGVAVQLWDIATHQVINGWKHSDSAFQVAWSDAQTLVVGDGKGALLMVPLAAFEPIPSRP